MHNLRNLVGGLLPFVPVAIAAANYPAIPSDKTTPVQQRLAISGANSISVGWNTFAQQAQPCVQYGTTSSNLDLEQCSDISVTYKTSRTWSNTVILSGLAAGQTYYYKIVSTNSTVESFMSPRAPGDRTPFTTSVVIDLGVYGQNGYTIKGDNSKRDQIPTIDPALNHTTIGRLAENFNDYEWVMHPGDLAYADDWILNIDNLLDGANTYEAITENFYNQLSPIASRKPYMTSPGNHEADCAEVGTLAIRTICPEGQKNFTDFNVRFGKNMPSAFSSTSSDDTAKINANKAKMLANPPFWYSFEYGMVHVTMIDTETDFPNAPDAPFGSAGLDGGPFGYTGQQLDFLKADLASVDRNLTPWVIVGGHRPWYSTGGSACTACQMAFEPVMYQYGVDLGVFGHVHNSQRFAPVNNSVVDSAGMNDPKSPVYIVAGGAGNIEGLSSVGSNISSNRFAYADDFSYATLNFQDENHLEINFIRSSTGEILDSSTLYKSHSEQFVAQ